MATSYRFSLGNSTVGAVGICFDVIANTPGDAVRKARKALRDSESLMVDMEGASDARVYVNGDAKEITEASIVMETAVLDR